MHGGIENSEKVPDQGKFHSLFPGFRFMFFVCLGDAMGHIFAYDPE